METLKRHKYLIILLCAVFVVNLGYSLFYRIQPVVDAAAYDTIAWNTVQGIGYLEIAANEGMPEVDNAIARVGPGFEFFLIVLYSIFGHQVWVVWLAHALLRVAIALLIFLIARKLFLRHGETTGLIAAALVGFFPDLIVLQAMLMTETLGLVLMALSVWLVLLVLERPSYSRTLLLGVALAFATLTRPTNLLLWLIMLGVLFWRHRWRQGLVLAGVVVLLMTPWTVRNFKVYGHFIPTSATGGYDLWVGNNPGAKGGFDKTPEINEARARLHITELERLGFQKYFAFMYDRPLKFAELQIRKGAQYFSLIRPTGFWSYLRDRTVHQVGTIIASGVAVGGLLLFGMSGAVAFFRRRTDLPARLVLAFAAIQPATVIPIIVEARYRTPFLVFLTLFAAYFLVAFFKEHQSRKTLAWTAGGVLAALLVITGIDFAYSAGDVFAHINAVL